MSGTETVDGIEVRVTRTPGAPLIMLVRMASQGIGIWDAIWDDIARHFTVASFDLVGAARLDAELSPRQRFRALADVVVRTASGLGFERSHLFGWYGGAHVALAALLDHGPRIASCVSSSTTCARSRRRSRSSARSSRPTGRSMRTTG